MSWLWGLGALFAVIAAAALYEAWSKRGAHRPLSSYSINQRRWDDPHRDGHEERHQVVTAETGVGRQGLSGKYQYRVSKDPEDQARMLMPDHAKNKMKEETNE